MLEELVQQTRHADMMREAEAEQCVQALLGPTDDRLAYVSPVLRGLGGGFISLGTRLQRWAAKPGPATYIEGRLTG